MKNPLRRILITTSSNFDVVILQLFKRLAQNNSIQVDLFDSARISSENSDKKFQFKKLEIDTSVERQLATALIQDVDLKDNKDCLESIDNNLSFHDNISRNQILWYSVQQYLITNEIDSVVFSNNPQGLNEIVLYQVSKEREIDVLILNQSPFSNRFFSYRSIHDCGNYDKHVKMPTENLLSNDEILTKQKQSCCEESIFSDYFKVLTFLARVRSLKLLNPVYIHRHAKHLHDAPANITNWTDPFAKFFYCKSTAYFEFLTNRFANKIDDSQKFVYFPLQAIAELHSEVIDNHFGDQLFALERLALLVPIDCKIYVKNDQNRGSDYLSPMSFHRIKRILNVVVLPSCIDSEQLIDHSMFVATVNSQEGWKALSRGKRVLTFGKPWYRKLPGTIEFHEGVEYIEILEKEISKENYLYQTSILHFHSHIGSLFPIGEYGTNVSEDAENANRVAETILELVSGQKKTTFQSERVVL